MDKIYDGQFFKASLRAAEALLEEHKDELNELNVFPVPDGDTGTNMLFTVRGAVKKIAELPISSTAEVIVSAARAALLAARGNSGVILSQILMGIANGLRGKEHFSPSDFAKALALGAKKAYDTVANPVEGTILTVVREAAEAAQRAAQRGADLASMMAEITAQAGKAVERTPQLLPVLQEAGVVDAGGKGLYYVLQAMQFCASEIVPISSGRVSGPQVSDTGKAKESYGYEIQLVIRGQGLPYEEARARIGEMGESVLVVGDSSLIKVHVHTPRPDRVLAYALDLGHVSDVTIEDLDAQVEARRASNSGGG